MTTTETPNNNDILLGRGGNNNKHVGNERLRNIARSKVNLYCKSSKKEKSQISRSIVAHIRNLHPPGRFLKRDNVNKSWEETGDDTAREKASQALRDAVAEVSRGIIHTAHDGFEISPPHLPSTCAKTSSSSRGVRHANDHCKRRRVSHDDTKTKPLRSPPSVLSLVDHRPSSNYVVPVPPTQDIYDKRPTPVITRDDPQHWIDFYSRNKNGHVDPSKNTSTIYPQQYHQDNYPRFEVSPQFKVETPDWGQSRHPGFILDNRDPQVHSGDATSHEYYHNGSNNLKNIANKDGGFTLCGRVDHRPESAISFVSMDDTNNAQLDDDCNLSNGLFDLELFQW